MIPLFLIVLQLFMILMGIFVAVRGHWPEDFIKWIPFGAGWFVGFYDFIVNYYFFLLPVTILTYASLKWPFIRNPKVFMILGILLFSFFLSIKLY